MCPSTPGILSVAPHFGDSAQGNHSCSLRARLAGTPGTSFVAPFLRVESSCMRASLLEITWHREGIPAHQNIPHDQIFVSLPLVTLRNYTYPTACEWIRKWLRTFLCCLKMDLLKWGWMPSTLTVFAIKAFCSQQPVHPHYTVIRSDHQLQNHHRLPPSFLKQTKTWSSFKILHCELQ